MNGGGQFSTDKGGQAVAQRDAAREYFSITNLSDTEAWLTTGKEARADAGEWLPAGRNRFWVGVMAKKQWKAYCASSEKKYCTEMSRAGI